MGSRDTLAAIAREVATAMEPLEQALASPEGFAHYMADLGWDFSAIPPWTEAVTRAVSSVAALMGQNQRSGGDTAEVVKGLASVLECIRAFEGQADSGLPQSVDPTEFREEFPRQVVDHLLTLYLRSHLAPLGHALALLGILRERYHQASGKRLAYVSRTLAWEGLGSLFRDPSGLFREAYSWGTLDFAQEQLLDEMCGLFTSLGLSAMLDWPESGAGSYARRGALSVGEIHHYWLRVPLYAPTFSVGNVQAGIGILPLPASGDGMPGIALSPYFRGEVGASFPVGGAFSLELTSDASLTGGIALLVRPGKTPALAADVFGAADSGASAASAAELGIALVGRPVSGESMILFGGEGGSRLEAGSVSLRCGARASADGEKDAYGELEVQKGRIIIKPAEGESDSFLSSLLPKEGVSCELSLLMGLSTHRGLYFGGPLGLEIKLPVHIEIGPIRLTGLLIGLKPGETGVSLALASSICGAAGPLTAAVEDIGLRALVAFPPDRRGNLGPLDVSVGFLPPKGVGLAISAGPVKGGGYLYLDYDKREYAGALQLVFGGYLNLCAIGLINTRMPDGSKGFSLLVIITAEFGSGLQLGYGFALLGVGGLLGLNRQMKLQPLMEGVRSGAVQGIMFPTNLIENAPRIISDLRAIFPPKEGIFLIGPMAKIGWGAGLITVSLCIVIEIPGNIAILGVIRAALPKGDDPVLVLQVCFAGAIEFDKKRLYFFATLFESRVLSFALDGDMGLLVAWGDDANFVLSVGGFHPRFNPPALPFPSLNRLSITILDRENARIQVMSYFAITSNTVQFGAKADLFFGFSSFKVTGYVAFDALFQFSPFYFIIETSGEVSLKVAGQGLFSIRLHLSLEGPTPWRVKGTGSLSILFFEIEVDFDKTWGKERETSLPPIDVIPLLKAEIEKPESWIALLPTGSGQLVSVRPLECAQGEVVQHPTGALRVSQKSVPLDLDIDKVGNQRARDARRLSLEAVSGLAMSAEAEEQFALGQFQDMDNAAKLSLPAFQKLRGGIELSAGTGQVASSFMAKRVVRHEAIIIDSNYKRFEDRACEETRGLFDHFLMGNAVALSPLSAARRKQVRPFHDGVGVKSDGFAVVFTADNQPYSDETRAFGSEASARDCLGRLCRESPSLVDDLHVIPQVEVNVS